jgi:hypothetical protein
MSSLEDAARLASPRTAVCMAWLTAILCRRRRGAARVAVATSMAHLATKLVKPIVSREGDVLGLIALGAAHMALRATRPEDRCRPTRHPGSA